MCFQVDVGLEGCKQAKQANKKWIRRQLVHTGETRRIKFDSHHIGVSKSLVVGSCKCAKKWQFRAAAGATPLENVFDRGDAG
jgi:hypothetical protein